MHSQASPVPDIRLLERVEQLGRAAYLCRQDDSYFVVKRAPVSQSLASRIARYFVGGSLPFRNEWFVNNALMENEYRFLKFPLLVNGACGEYLVFERLIESDSSSSVDVRRKAVDALLELNVTRATFAKGVFERILFRVLERPPWTLIRRGLRSAQPVRTKLQLLLSVLRFSLKQRRLVPVLLHNDLAFSNILVTTDSEIALVDFEDSVVEDKWILMDFIDLTFDRESLYLDFDETYRFAERLCQKSGCDMSDADIEPMIRMCLIRHGLYSAENPDFDADVRREMAAFLKTLLDDSAYGEWALACRATRPQGTG